MEHLVVRLQEDAGSAQWAVFDEDGRVVREAETGPLAEATAQAAGRRVIVLVPGTEVVLTETTLPKASPARLRKMLPFSLEDTLAEDVEELAFAVGGRQESGAVAVAVAARARLESWLDRIAAAGLAPQALYSDADGVPDTPATLTLIVEDERIYGRAPGRPAFVFEGLTLEQVVEAVDAERELQHAIVYVDEAAQARHADQLRELGEVIENVQLKLMADGALYRLGATLAVQPGTNLLQGDYAPRSNVAALLRPWRAAAGLLIGLVLVSIAAQAAEYFSLRGQSEALEVQLSEVCQQEFSVSLNQCERVVRQRLSQAGVLTGGPGFLPALSAVAEARTPGSRLSALDYSSGRLLLEISVSDVSSLDAFEREAEGSGVFADVRVQSLSSARDGATQQARVELITGGANR